MTTKLVAAGAAALSTLALVACGGGDDNGGDTLKKADLVKKAEAICSDVEKKANAVEVPQNIADAGQAAPYFKKLAGFAHEQHDKLSALKPESAAKADYDAFLKAEDTAVELIDGLAKAAADKDAAKGAELLQQVSANTTYEAAAKKAGIAGCAS